MRRRTVMACESEGETISPSGVSEKPRSLDTSVIRSSLMKRLIFPLLLGLGIFCSAVYFGMYSYYRFINPDAVIDHFRVRGTGAFSALSIGENSCGDSIVSQLSDWTGTSISPTVNHLYFPLMELDLLVTGRSIRFTETFRIRRH